MSQIQIHSGVSATMPHKFETGVDVQKCAIMVININLILIAF